MRAAIILIALLVSAGCTQPEADDPATRVSAPSERSGVPDPTPADPDPYIVFLHEDAVRIRAPNPLIRETCYDVIANCLTFAQAEGVDYGIVQVYGVPKTADLVRFQSDYGLGAVSPDYRVFDGNGTELPFHYYFMLQETWANSTSAHDAHRGAYQIFVWMPQGAEQNFQVRLEAYDFPSA